MLAILEASDHVVLVAVPEFSMMKDLIQVKRILQDVLHVAIGRIHLVVNHRNGSATTGSLDPDAAWWILLSRPDSPRRTCLPDLFPWFSNSRATRLTHR